MAPKKERKGIQEFIPDKLPDVDSLGRSPLYLLCPPYSFTQGLIRKRDDNSGKNELVPQTMYQCFPITDLDSEGDTMMKLTEQPKEGMPMPAHDEEAEGVEGQKKPGSPKKSEKTPNKLADNSPKKEKNQNKQKQTPKTGRNKGTGKASKGAMRARKDNRKAKQEAQKAGQDEGEETDPEEEKDAAEDGEPIVDNNEGVHNDGFKVVAGSSTDLDKGKKEGVDKKGKQYGLPIALITYDGQALKDLLETAQAPPCVGDVRKVPVKAICSCPTLAAAGGITYEEKLGPKTQLGVLKYARDPESDTYYPRYTSVFTTNQSLLFLQTTFKTSETVAEEIIKEVLQVQSVDLESKLVSTCSYPTLREYPVANVLTYVQKNKPELVIPCAAILEQTLSWNEQYAISRTDNAPDAKMTPEVYINELRQCIKDAKRACEDNVGYTMSKTTAYLNRIHGGSSSLTLVLGKKGANCGSFGVECLPKPFSVQPLESHTLENCVGSMKSILESHTNKPAVVFDCMVTVSVVSVDVDDMDGSLTSVRVSPLMQPIRKLGTTDFKREVVMKDIENFIQETPDTEFLKALSSELMMHKIRRQDVVKVYSDVSSMPVRSWFNFPVKQNAVVSVKGGVTKSTSADDMFEE